MRPEARGLLCQCKGSKRVALSLAATDMEQARRWMRGGASGGLDGVVAKRLDCGYASGERTGMVKSSASVRRTAWWVGFYGEAPGGPSRWAREDRNTDGFRWSTNSSAKCGVTKLEGAPP